MIRVGNYTTILLVIIVAILLFGVGIALYYVLGLDWFSNSPVEIYNEPGTSQQGPVVEVRVEKEIKYDLTKRTYNLILNTDEFKIVAYKDGTVGITMLENEKYNKVAQYNELVNVEVKLDLTNIIRAYEVQASKEAEPEKHILLLDSVGNLYDFAEQELLTNGKYFFTQIQGVAKIIDVREITNDALTENTTGINVIAIDEESNEILLTNYLIKE